MKITVEQAVSITQVLTDNKDLKLPFLVSYRLNAIREAVAPIAKRFEDTKNKLIIEKYGEEDAEKKGTFKIKEDNLKDFIDDLNKVLLEEEEINVKNINVKDFGNIEVNPIFTSALSMFIVDEE